MNEITTYEQSMKTFEDNVRLKIKTTFMELIPPQVLDDTIKRNIFRFMQEDLANLVRNELNKLIIDRIKAALESPEFTQQYGLNGQLMASDMVNKLVRENAQDIMSGVIGSFVQQCVNDLRQRNGQHW